MSDFNARWRQLASAARRHQDALGLGATSDGERIDTARAAAIVARSLADSRVLEVSDLRGLVLAASLFCACLLGLSWSASRFGFAASIEDSARDLTQLARCAPATSFIPQPPGLAAIGLASRPSFEPELAAWPGVELLSYLDGWLAQKPMTGEISR